MQLHTLAGYYETKRLQGRNAYRTIYLSSLPYSSSCNGIRITVRSKYLIYFLLHFYFPYHSPLLALKRITIFNL